jgi:hypothetical protein
MSPPSSRPAISGQRLEWSSGLSFAFLRGSRGAISTERLDPELATLLGSVRVAPNGEGLEVSFAVSSDQMVSLIKRNTFSATATFGGLVRGMCGRAK